MDSLLVGIFVLICCTIGLVEVIGLCSICFTRPHSTYSYSLVPIYPKEAGVEQKLRWAANSLRWDRWLGGGHLIILDMGADAQALAICHAFLKNRDYCILCTPAQLMDAVGDPGVYKTFKGVLY